jgi:hypothetical protein
MKNKNEKIATKIHKEAQRKRVFFYKPLRVNSCNSWAKNKGGIK